MHINYLCVLHSNQVFLQDAETLDSVTVSQESFLANEDLGVSTIIIINFIITTIMCLEFC